MLNHLMERLAEFDEGIRAHENGDVAMRWAHAKEITPWMSAIRLELHAMDGQDPQVQSAIAKHLAVLEHMYVTCFGMDPDFASVHAAERTQWRLDHTT